LPFSPPADVCPYHLDLSLAEVDLEIAPSEPLSIIGFPLGLSSGGMFPIWKTGHVASDMDVDYGGLPVFLVDATTKHGMSGSPVIARRIGMSRRPGTIVIGGGTVQRFLGVYSGRISEESDIGMVWKPVTLRDILGVSPVASTSPDPRAG
jgi:hypothetical protein